MRAIFFPYHFIFASYGPSKGDGGEGDGGEGDGGEGSGGERMIVGRRMKWKERRGWWRG